MSNFLFLQTHFPDFQKAARDVEKNVHPDPRAACFYARRALEIALDWLFEHDAALVRPYDTTLSALLFEPTFRNSVPPAIWVKAKLLKDLGNRAVHDKTPVSPAEGLAAARELFHVFFWLARTYSSANPPADSLQFDAAKLPAAPSQIVQKSLAALQLAREELDAQRAELQNAQTTGAALQVELEAARQEIAAAKALAAKRVDTHDYSEQQTRDFYIDLYLREAGWLLQDARDTEWEVLGMPPDRSKNGRGFVDYVLWGRDGKPLALVEAKRARKDARDALEQARLYASCLEKEFGRRPLIFTCNGYEHFLWDDAGGYPPRPVAGFYTRDELERLHERRASRQPLSTAKINSQIVERPYQTRAIRAFCADLEISRRRGLLVMATGTGKTRVSIALCELLSRMGWAKNILFLCDRRALVRQTFNAFKAHWPDCAPVNLLEDPDATGRVCVSTYPTMMNLLEKFESGESGAQRRFGPGYFDLVIIDEAHRGVYQKYRALFSYFDALFLGLTATPRSQVERDTFKLFECYDNKPTDSYELAEAVAQGYLVPPRVMAVPTRFLRHGMQYDELSEAEREEWDAREWNAENEVPDEVDAAEINAWVFNRDTVSKVIATLMEKGQRVAGGDRIAKTIVFARNREHAKEICKVFNENYPHLAGITARVITGDDPFAQSLIDQFSHPDNPLDIAISVDMLDTGIDVPEVANLVFFKPVRSRVKWSQMLGRGTRLCPDLFGSGNHKKEFFVFDFCGNYEYFNENPDVREAAPAKTLSVRLFTHRVELLDGTTQIARMENQPEVAQIRDELADGLHREVAAMNVSNVLVRPHRREVEKWRERAAWESVGQAEKRELDEKLAALPTEIPLEDETARQFDLLVYRLELATLKKEKRWAKLAAQVRAIAHLLLTTSARHVPMVASQVPLLEEMDTDDWWVDVSLPILENARKKIRDLVRFIEKSKRYFVFLDIEDDFEQGQEIVYAGADAPLATSPALYKRSVEQFLHTHRESGVVGRLHRNEELAPEDLEELDRQLFQVGGFPDRATFEREIGPQEDLGEFVRRCIDLENAALRGAFAKFLDGGTLSPAQIAFVEAIVAYLAQNGMMERKQLSQDPWNRIHARGMTDLFGSVRAREILSIIDAVNHNASVI
ncbi:MAG: DEAD/DEAH box helicase family protein [Armatimonadetes bacterium]|nr:DEAD/DEAH box helicase family protein [Armatimonadota bacterium]